MFLCPGHFTSDQFFSPIERKSLKRFAVPTVFDVQPLSETQMNIYKTHCDNTCTETSCGYSEHGIDLEPLGKHKLSDEEEDADEVASKVFVLDAENWEDEIPTTTPVGTNEDSGEPVPEILDSPDDTSPSPPLTEVKAPRIGRTLIPNGSKLRSKTCTRARVSANRLLQMSGVQKPKSAISADCAKVLRTAQQYRTMAQDVVRRLKLCQRQKTSMEKLCKRKFINQVEELLISPTSRQILRGELRNFRKKPRGPPTTPAPASTPVRRLVTPASSRRGNVPLTVTPTALSFQSPGIFPISGTPKLGLNGTSMTSASRSCSSPMNVGSLEGTKKVMAAWASSSSCTPVQPLPTPEAPIDMEQLARAGKVETLTRPVIAEFLKGKCKVSNIKKQDLCAAVYSFFNIQRK
ncbi:Cell pattern formation-associated protein stuA [Frankliniella fusca]|uniref:Cell pattern formation-associated protein stuA n=1 Tax=Frankliniella fusca TaxID=407009 RepID=A0AAE1HQ25_9NEOP|nr:Cell pattern formation-associated protein stuA [Frankliniella fusca]